MARIASALVLFVCLTGVNPEYAEAQLGGTYIGPPPTPTPAIVGGVTMKGR